MTCLSALLLLLLGFGDGRACAAGAAPSFTAGDPAAGAEGRLVATGESAPKGSIKKPPRPKPR